LWRPGRIFVSAFFSLRAHRTSADIRQINLGALRSPPPQRPRHSRGPTPWRWRLGGLGVLGPSDAGARITADPTTTSVAISAPPALPTGLVRSPPVRPPEPGALCCGPGVIAPAAVRGIGCPLWPWCHSGDRTTPTTCRQLGRPPSPRWATSRLPRCKRSPRTPFACRHPIVPAWLDANSLGVTARGWYFGARLAGCLTESCPKPATFRSLRFLKMAA
jgi:hypothetical protein